MKKRNYLTLDDEFLMYCQLNNIENIDKLAKDTFNRGFTILKYGEVPVKIPKGERIVEVIKEVPVEKIVEIIKEVPINTEIDTKTYCKELEDENQKLKSELDKITKTLEGFNKAKYLKNSDLNTLYDE